MRLEVASQGFSQKEWRGLLVPREDAQLTCGPSPSSHRPPPPEVSAAYLPLPYLVTFQDGSTLKRCLTLHLLSEPASQAVFPARGPGFLSELQQISARDSLTVHTLWGPPSPRGHPSADFQGRQGCPAEASNPSSDVSDP